MFQRRTIQKQKTKMKKSKLLLILFFLISFAPFAKCQSTEPGLIGYWKFDAIENGIVKDNSGNGLDGRVVNFTLTDGKAGKAMKGIGSGYLEIPWKPVSDSLERGLTVCAWISHDSSNSWNCIITREIGNGWSEYFDIGTNDNKALFSIDPGGKDLFTKVEEIKPCPVNKWIYLVGVYNNKSLLFYIDGILVSEGKLDIPIKMEDKNPIIIGSNTNDEGKTWHDYFYGLIDEVKLYNRPLSEKEVQFLFSSYKK
jgi:hypothetical protein